MNITKFTLSTLIATASLCAAAHAGPAAPADPVVASFQRMLAHEPGQTVPVRPVSLMDDPLRVCVSEVLWEKQEPSFHLAQNAIAASPRPSPQN